MGQKAINNGNSPLYLAESWRGKISHREVLHLELVPCEEVSRYWLFGQAQQCLYPLFSKQGNRILRARIGDTGKLVLNQPAKVCYDRVLLFILHFSRTSFSFRGTPFALGVETRNAWTIYPFSELLNGGQHVFKDGLAPKEYHLAGCSFKCCCTEV